MTIPNDVVFVLIGSDADLTILKKLGVKTEAGKLTEVPIYDPETFETNIPGIYVAGHFTHARHIKEAIAVPRRIVPLIAQSTARACVSTVVSNSVRPLSARDTCSISRFFNPARHGLCNSFIKNRRNDVFWM